MDRSDDICVGSNVACLLGKLNLSKNGHFNIAKIQAAYKISGCTSQGSSCESNFVVGVKIQLNLPRRAEAATERGNGAWAYAPFGVSWGDSYCTCS